MFPTWLSHYSYLSEYHNNIRLTAALVRVFLSNPLTRKVIQVMQIKAIWKQNLRCKHLEGMRLHRGALNLIKASSFIVPGVSSDQSAKTQRKGKAPTFYKVSVGSGFSGSFFHSSGTKPLQGHSWNHNKLHKGREEWKETLEAVFLPKKMSIWWHHLDIGDLCLVYKDLWM